MRLRTIVAIAALGLWARAAHAEGHLEEPLSVTSLGTYGGVEVVTARGRFVGSVGAGSYRVPYWITFRVDVDTAEGVELLFEPPHFAGGPGARDLFLGREFVFGRMELAHASVGYTFNGRAILEPGAPDVFIQDVAAREILADFAWALRGDPVVRQLVGGARRVYVTGYSQSTVALLELLASGRTRPDGGTFFDLAVPFVISGVNSPLAAAAVLPGTKIIAFASENEAMFPLAKSYRDNGAFPDRYRSHESAGAGHTRIPDVSILPGPLLDPRQSSVEYSAELRARFREGVRWVRTGEAPGPSVFLAPATGVDPLFGIVSGVARDENLNALSLFAEYDAAGTLTTRPAPRHPALEVGEGTFKTRQVLVGVGGITGMVVNAHSIGDAGFFATHEEYVDAFKAAVRAQRDAGLILADDAASYIEQARTAPPATFTQRWLASQSF